MAFLPWKWVIIGILSFITGETQNLLKPFQPTDGVFDTDFGHIALMISRGLKGRFKGYPVNIIWTYGALELTKVMMNYDLFTILILIKDWS